MMSSLVWLLLLLLGEGLIWSWDCIESIGTEGIWFSFSMWSDILIYLSIIVKNKSR